MFKLFKKQNLIKSNLKSYGWHCCNAFDPEGINSNFSYSIGFESTFNHPEIIIFGLEADVSHQILSDLAIDIQNGVTFEIDAKLKNVIGGDYEVMFKEVKAEHFSNYLGQAVDHYNKPFRAWALLWPDKNNTLPIEDNCLIDDQNEALKIIK